MGAGCLKNVVVVFPEKGCMRSTELSKCVSVINEDAVQLTQLER